MGQAVETIDMQNILSVLSSSMIEFWYSFRFDVIGILDAHGFVKYISDKCFDFYGVDQKSMVNTFIFDRVHKDDLQNVLEKFNYLVTTRTTQNVDVRILRPDGTLVNIHAKAEPLIIDDKVAAVVVMSRKNISFMGDFVKNTCPCDNYKKGCPCNKNVS